MRSLWHHHPAVRTGADLSRGERAADWMRNRLGSWGFVAGFVLLMACWAGLNTYVLARGAFDPYPYILLNLFLSMLAGLQGAILLIAAKRADQIASEVAMHTLTNTTGLHELVASNAVLIAEVHAATCKAALAARAARGA